MNDLPHCRLLSATAATTKQMPFQNLRSIKIPPFPKFITAGLLPEAGRFIIGGMSKIGKSFLNLEYAISVASGTPFLGIFPNRPQRAALVQAEMPEQMFLASRIAPVMAKYAANGVGDRFFLEQNTQFRLDNVTANQALKAELGRIRPAFLSIDPLYTIITGSFSEMNTVMECLRALDFIVDYEPGCKAAAGLVSHMRKAFITKSGKRVDQDSQDILGSVAFQAWADCIITVTPLKADDEFDIFPTRRVSFWTRWLPPLGSMDVEIHGTPPFCVPKNLSPRLRVLQTLNTGHSNTASAISVRTKSDYRFVGAWLNELVRCGVLNKMGDQFGWS